MIPETEFFYAQRIKKCLPGFVLLHLFRQAVMKAIKFHRQFCAWTIEIQIVLASPVLTAKFKTSETAGFERLPELLLFLGLIAT